MLNLIIKFTSLTMLVSWKFRNASLFHHMHGLKESGLSIVLTIDKDKGNMLTFPKGTIIIESDIETGIKSLVAFD